jgi:hypothetical protein
MHGHAQQAGWSGRDGGVGTNPHNSLTPNLKPTTGRYHRTRANPYFPDSGKHVHGWMSEPFPLLNNSIARIAD